MRTKDFTIVVAPGIDGTASGSLYLDEGNNLEQPAISEIVFSYANGTFSMGGTFGFDTGDVAITSIVLLNSSGATATNSTPAAAKRSVATIERSIPLTRSYTTKLA